MWIYGINPIRELLNRRPNEVKKIGILSTSRPGPALLKISELAGRNNIPLAQMTRPQMTDLCSSDAHQGIIAQAPLPAYQALDQIIKKTEKPSLGLILLLDSIMDPHNLGAIIRVAEEAGAQAVVITKDRSCGLTPAVLKASAGAGEWIPVCMVTNLHQTLVKLKKAGYWTASAEASGDMEYQDMDFNLPLALVIGSEGKGLRQLVEKTCDFHLRIPLQGRIGSLNASVAAAVILFEAVRQRKGSKEKGVRGQ